LQANASDTEPENTADEPRDLLDLANGAVVLSYTAQYSEKWPAIAILSGSNKIGWASPKHKPTPHHFIIELPQNYELEKLVVDNSGNEEKGYPGISAKDVVFYASTTSATEGFEEIYAGEALQGEKQTFELETPAKARWLKVEIKSNFGHKDYTELMELEAYGKPVDTAPEPPALTGYYKTNYNLLQFQQDGNKILGCYDWDHGYLNGSAQNNAIRFEWFEDGNQHGTALLVASMDGEFINGMWYENGTYRGTWFGSRDTSGEKTKCQIKATDNPVEKALLESGQAVVYGIYFDYDKDEPKPESDKTLQDMLTALQNNEQLKVDIEGHTDAKGSDDYNKDLSQRRADSVVQWLIDHGIDKSRMTPIGHGEAKPVSDNETPQGRALNRRVAIVVQD
jgi:outer membrane protein OmpA-like peptidoglycan-associated protein